MATPNDDAKSTTGGDTASSGGRAMSVSLPAVGHMPGGKRLLWLGGLAAAGALGVLEWPVVAAIGVGSYVAERFARNEVEQDLRKAQGAGTSPPP